MGTNLCLPGGISSMVATTCSRPWASRGVLSSSLTGPNSPVAALLPSGSKYPHLTLEGRHRFGQVVGRDAVAEHHGLPCVFGEVLDQPAWIIEGPVRVVGGEQQNLLALHPLECASEFRLVLGVVQWLSGELDVILDVLRRVALDVQPR